MRTLIYIYIYWMFLVRSHVSLIELLLFFPLSLLFFTSLSWVVHRYSSYNPEHCQFLYFLHTHIYMERERKSPNPFFCNCKSETNPPKSYPATSASRQIPHFVQHQYVCMYVWMYVCMYVCMHIKSETIKVHIAFHWQYNMKITNLVQLQRLTVASTIELNTCLQNGKYPKQVIYNGGSMCAPNISNHAPLWPRQADPVFLHSWRSS